MKRVEYMHDKNFYIYRDDDVLSFSWLWSKNVRHISDLDPSVMDAGQLVTAGTVERETDKSDGEDDNEVKHKEAYVCPKLWSFHGLLPNILVWALAFGNIILLIELLFIQNSFTASFT